MPRTGRIWRRTLRVDPRIAMYCAGRTRRGIRGQPVSRRDGPRAGGGCVVAVATEHGVPTGGRSRRRCSLPARSSSSIGLVALVLSLGPRPSAFGHVIAARAIRRGWRRGCPGWARCACRPGSAWWCISRWRRSRRTARHGCSCGSGRPGHTVVAVALAVLVTAEGYGAPLPMHALRRAGSLGHRQAWRWIRTQPPQPIVEMPVLDMAYPDHHARDVQDGTLVHGRPLINGSSRFGSEIQNLLGSEGSPLRDPAQFHDAFEFLQQLKVGDVLVHPDWYGDKAMAQATLDFLSASSDQIARSAVFRWTRSSSGFARRQLPPVDRRQPLPAGGYRLTSSHDNAHLPFLSDGDLFTGWKTFEPQQGREWIALEFPASDGRGRRAFRAARLQAARIPPTTDHRIVGPMVATSRRCSQAVCSRISVPRFWWIRGALSSTCRWPPIRHAYCGSVRSVKQPRGSGRCRSCRSSCVRLRTEVRGQVV